MRHGIPGILGAFGQVVNGRHGGVSSSLMFAIAVRECIPSRVRSLLLICLLSILPATGSAEGPVENPDRPLAGTGFQARIRGSDLVSWQDPDFASSPLLGTRWYLAQEGGAPPREVASGIRIGASPTATGLPPGWSEHLSVEAEWKAGDRPHTLDLVVTIRNQSPQRIVMRENPLMVTMGPLGPPAKAPSQPAELKALVVNGKSRSVVSHSPGDSVSEDARWLAYQVNYATWAIEILGESPGRLEALGVKAGSLADGSDAVQAVFLGLRPAREIAGNEELVVRLRFFAGLTTEKALQGAGYPELFNLWSGWTGPIGYLMFKLLHGFFLLTGSWGLSIVLLTIAVKLLLHPLNRRQLESMNRMQELQPRIQAIQARYADNQQKMQQEIAKLWQESGFNPLSGCFPILLQLPIFIALYSCLSNATELRGVSYLWLADLSHPDPLLVLPALFALGIYVSSATGPAANDPNQRTMMQVMPLMMFFFMLNIASGVMIYLAGQTLLGIFEQRYNQRYRRSPGTKAETAGDPPTKDIDNEDVASSRASSEGEEEAAGPGKQTGNKYKRKGRR